jgi:hypothetical protein
MLTPGSTAGEPVHILSSLERRSSSWDTDPEASRAAVSAAISLVPLAFSWVAREMRSQPNGLDVVLANGELSLVTAGICGAAGGAPRPGKRLRSLARRPRNAQSWANRLLLGGEKWCRRPIRPSLAH